MSATATDSLATIVLRYFRGRSDCVAVPNGKGFKPQKLKAPLAPERLQSQHIGKRGCLGFYLLNAESNVYCSAVDFDNKRDNPDPKWKEKTEAVVDQLESLDLTPLVELSQSGSGSHVWLFFSAAVPAWLVRRFWDVVSAGVGIKFHEVYPRQDRLPAPTTKVPVPVGSLIRYPLWNKSAFIDVGDDWQKLDPAEALAGVKQIDPADFRELCATLSVDLTEPSQVDESSESTADAADIIGAGPTGDEILTKCLNAANGDKFERLWRGEKLPHHPSNSEAHMALAGMIAFWSGPRPDAIERLMRRSGFGDCEKFQRDDYLPTLIEKTLAGKSADDFYKWNGHAAHGDGEPRFNLTDVGNAKRLVFWHGQNFRYCFPWAKPVCWDDKRWRVDDTGAMERAAKDTVRRIWKKVPNEPDESKRKELAKFAANSEKAERIRAMIALARSEPGIPVMPDQFDADPYLLNTPAGTVDVRTGQLRPHRREDLLTRMTRADYLPANECECPLWEKTVEGIFAGKAELIRYVRRLIGYSLIGMVSDAILPIFWGGGSNGKSLFVETLLYVIGPDYADTIQPDVLLASYGDRHPTERADLFGKRLVCAVETDDNRRLSESAVKALTGGDTIKARRMREDFWSFRPSHTVVLISNHKPIVRGNDHGLWRRLRLIPFTVRFWNRRKGETGPPELEADEDLAEKLKDEADGILRWCVDGALDWQRNKLADPDEVRAATAEYRRDSDTLGEFLSARCWVEGQFADGQGSDEQYPLEKYPIEIPPDGLYEPSARLYRAYKFWCARRCDESVTANRFGRYLGERGFRREKVGTIRWYGLVLKDNHDWDHE